MRMGLSISTGSTSIPAVPPLGPTVTTAPSLPPAASIADTISVDPGQWSGAGGVTFAYQWVRDAMPIAGAISTTYIVTAQDAGSQLRCIVRATDSQGSRSVQTGPCTIQSDWAVTGGAGGLIISNNPQIQPPIAQGGTAQISFTG